MEHYQILVEHFLTNNKQRNKRIAKRLSKQKNSRVGMDGHQLEIGTGKQKAKGLLKVWEKKNKNKRNKAKPTKATWDQNLAADFQARRPSKQREKTIGWTTNSRERIHTKRTTTNRPMEARHVSNQNSIENLPIPA